MILIYTFINLGSGCCAMPWSSIGRGYSIASYSVNLNLTTPPLKLILLLECDTGILSSTMSFSYYKLPSGEIASCSLSEFSFIDVKL